jgi:hypothetical protein
MFVFNRHTARHLNPLVQVCGGEERYVYLVSGQNLAKLRYRILLIRSIPKVYLEKFVAEFDALDLDFFHYGWQGKALL